MTPTRFDVIMPPDMAQDMQDLEQTTGLSRGAISQRALALYKLAIKTRSAGGVMCLLATQTAPCEMSQVWVSDHERAHRNPTQSPAVGTHRY
jgi:hypothetical protein